MSEPEKDREPSAGNGESGETADNKAKRRFWRMAATASSLGWSLVLPIVAGALLGNYLDKLTGREFVWTVGLLFGGVAMSLYNLYHILYKETIE